MDEVMLNNNSIADSSPLTPQSKKVTKVHRNSSKKKHSSDIESDESAQYVTVSSKKQRTKKKKNFRSTQSIDSGDDDFNNFNTKSTDDSVSLKDQDSIASNKSSKRFKWTNDMSQVALRLVKHGYKPKTVSIAVGCSLRTAQKFVETVTFKIDGENYNSFEIKRRGRRSKDINNRLDAIKKVLKKGANKTQIEIAAELNVSNTTVCRDLKKMNSTWKKIPNSEEDEDVSENEIAESSVSIDTPLTCEAVEEIVEMESLENVNDSMIADNSVSTDTTSTRKDVDETSELQNSKEINEPEKIQEDSHGNDEATTQENESAVDHEIEKGPSKPKPKSKKSKKDKHKKLRV